MRAQAEQTKLLDDEEARVQSRHGVRRRAGNRVGPITPATPKLDMRKTRKKSAREKNGAPKRPTPCTFRSSISRPHLSRSTYSAKPAACFGTLTERRFAIGDCGSSESRSRKSPCFSPQSRFGIPGELAFPRIL